MMNLIKLIMFIIENNISNFQILVSRINYNKFHNNNIIIS